MLNYFTQILIFFYKAAIRWLYVTIKSEASCVSDEKKTQT